MVPIEDVYEQIRTFAARTGVGKVILFGSRAKGTNRPTSDIDIAVSGCSDFDAFDTMVRNDLWSLLKVDVINLDEPVSAPLQDEIARYGKVLYEEV